MERIESRKTLATKIAYISNIIVYYGYMHECAELYRQLCKESRNEWDKNARAIVKVVMKHKNSRCILEFKNDFSHRAVKFLTNNNTYNYYRVKAYLNNKSYRYLTEFINNLEYYSKDLFYEVSINLRACDQALIQSFIDIYFSKEFDKKVLNFNPIPYYYCKVFAYVDNLSMNILSGVECKIKECRILSLSSLSLCNNKIYLNNSISKNLMKLKDIKFHNLKASISEIILMIEYFGDLDCDQDIIDPINSDYCARFILNVNHYNDFSKEFKIKYIAWLCARFPNLKEIELDGISNTINQTILENIMFNTEEKYSKYLSQINKIIWKQYKNNLDQESYIFISKSNIKLGVCINGKMTICKVNRFMINCKFDNVQIFESDFNQNQQYLLFNDDEIQFEIEGIQTDTHCGETEHLSYYKIMTGFISKKSNDCSLLFILQIEKITIPKNINDIPILLNIYINDDYKPTYKITWSQNKINKEFESFIDSLDNHSKVAVNVVEKIKSNNSLYSKIREVENKSCKIKNNTKDYLSSLCNLWSKLFSKNIVCLQVQDAIKSKSIFVLFINFLSGLDQIYKSRLNCLELKLESNQEVDLVLEAIKCNYAIKTIKLDTPNRVNSTTEDKAEKILSQRIATKICLNSKVKQFKFYLQKNFELSYPILWK